MYEITKLLTLEHERLVGLFRQYQVLLAAAPDEARRRLDEFTDGLQRHMAVEEQILFPRFETFTRLGNSGPTAVMRSEHAEIRTALARLGALRAGDGARDDAEKSLLDALRAHEAMEELVFSPWLDETLTEIERMALYEQIRNFSAPVKDAAHG